MNAMQAQLLSLLLAVASWTLVSGKPNFFIRKYSHGNCTAQPLLDNYYGSHGWAAVVPVSVDTGITFYVEARGHAITEVCPGRALDLTIEFPTSRAYLLTASAGVLDAGDSAYQDTECPNRQFLNFTTSMILTTWTVPCNTTGPVSLTVTTSEGAGMPLWQATSTFRLNFTCGNNCSAAAHTPLTGAPHPSPVVRVSQPAVSPKASPAAAASPPAVAASPLPSKAGQSQVPAASPVAPSAPPADTPSPRPAITSSAPIMVPSLHLQAAMLMLAALLYLKMC